MNSCNRLVLRSSIAAALLAAVPATATAGDAASDAEPIEQIVVTGSYIRGAVEDAALPVTVLDREELESQGSLSVLDVIRSLPASQGTVGEGNPGGVLFGTGAVSVNLRGFDNGRTLVLLNGKRLPVSPVALLGVDANLLPFGAVERIEVLKDGAAATYGSDAIAGVVNFITRRGFEGLSIDTSYTSIEDSDGDYGTSLLWGHKSDGYDVLVAASYRHRSELNVFDRDFALPPFDPTIPAQGGFSAGGSPGAFVIPPLTAVPNIFIDPACESLGGGIRATGGLPQCQFRFTQFQNVVDRQEEYGIYGEFNTQFGEFAGLHVEAYYSAHDVPEENVAPSFPATQGPGTSTQMRLGLPVDPTNAPTYIIPLNNPGLQSLLPSLTPAQANGIAAARAVAASGLLFRPLGPGGNPLFENEGMQRELFTDSYRFSAALDGEISNVGWNAALTYAENSRRVRIPDVLAANMQLALAGFGGENCTGTTPGAAANGCYFLNPFSTGVAANVVTGQRNATRDQGGTFDPATVNSREVIDFIFDMQGSDDTTTLLVADFVLNGDTPFDLPGGTVSWALGAQYREDELEREILDAASNVDLTPCADSLLNPAATCVIPNGPFATLGPQREFSINTDVYGVFGELGLPITESLQAQVAFRYEDYGGSTGSTSNPKLALRWQVADWLALRGSASSTFRGPALLQLQPNALTSLQFVPQFSTVRPVDNFGNPNLTPEEAENLSFGLVVSTPSFSASIDYFDIGLEDKVIPENGSDVLAAFIGTGTTAINNCGRAGYEALQARFTFQNGVCSPAGILRTRAMAVNSPDEEVRGIDVSASYRLQNVMRGGLLFGLDATYNLEYQRDPFFIEGILIPNAGGRDFIGTRAGVQTLPELRGALFAEFTAGSHSLRATGRYTDGVTDLRDAARNPDGSLSEIASYFTTDLVYRLSLPSDLTFTAAAFNVADRDPPVVRLTDYNYDPSFGNPVGRVFKLGLNKQFR
jgi:iron complex outermembrane receptor protein